MTRVLVTGAGSLVGFSILESLEGRRDVLELVGISDDGSESEAGRYDQFLVVPPSSDPQFPAELERVIDVVSPDLIIPGRDPDIEHLAQLRVRRPDLATGIMCGSPEAAAVTMDKARTWEFAREHGLPWADTFVCGPDSDSEIVSFARRHPLPWLLKPAKGSASLGVFVLTDLAHAQWWSGRSGYVIQPMLGRPRDVEPPNPAAGVPWFTDVGEPHLRSVQVLVGPTGGVTASFCSDHVLGMGITRRSRVAVDPDAVAGAERWAVALAAIGWRGSLNVQLKVDDERGPVPIEINGRPSGATHGRLLLGFDELALALESWTGIVLPPNPRPTGPSVTYRPRAWLTGP